MNQPLNRKFLLLPFALLFAALTTNAQTKSKDIDVLYQKYKNKDTISVTNANGTVKLVVEITLNIKGKPQSIILKGYADNVTLSESITNKLENDKTKAGYRYTSSATVHSDEILNVSVYTKGTQYAKYGVGRDIFGKNDPPPYETGTEEQKARRSQKYFFASMGGCFIYMEVGDISRKILKTTHNIRFGNMAGRRIYIQLFFANPQQSGLDFYYCAFVFIFIVSNSIRLRFRADDFQILPHRQADRV